MGQAVAVGVDIGGTKVAAGLIADDGTVLDRRRESTAATDPGAIDDAIVAVVADLDPDGRLPVGVGAAGVVAPDGSVRFAPNIAWRDHPLGAILADRLDGRRVVVDNDANALAWAEHRTGAAQGASSCVVLTLGTGVGGGLVLDGRVWHGASGFAAELGHVIVAEGGPECACGNHGCLESLASGTGIGRAARAALTAGVVPADSPLATADPLDGPAVTAAAHAGDEAARAVLSNVGHWLGVGIASLVNAIDPEVVVIGGGASAAGEHLLGPARSAAADRLLGGPARALPPIRIAALGDDAGLIGAALLAADTPSLDAGGTDVAAEVRAQRR